MGLPFFMAKAKTERGHMAKAKTENPAPGSMDEEIDKIVPKGAKFEGSTGPDTEVRITKFGAGKVSTGEHVPEQGDKMAKAGDILTVHLSVAEELEAKGFAEIQ